MTAVVLANVLIKVSFIAGACFLLVHGHPVAGAWMVFGAIISGYTISSKGDE